MIKSVLELKALASSGGSIVLDASKFTVLELKAIAASASKGRSQIILKNPLKTTLDLKGIATSGDGCVTFDFT